MPKKTSATRSKRKMPIAEVESSAKNPLVLVNFKSDLDLLNQIDDFRFQERFPSRTEAIRWLLRNALKQEPKR
jgi:hypothetical protein